MYPSGSHLHRGPAAGSPGIRPVFDILDLDRDGRISCDDLRAFLSSRFPAASEDDIATMISTADTDHSGFVEFDEFEQVLPGGGGGIIEEAFRLIDRDGDRTVGFDDLKGYLGWAKMDVTDEDVTEMMCSGGCDESAGVGFEDLLRILAVD